VDNVRIRLQTCPTSPSRPTPEAYTPGPRTAFAGRGAHFQWRLEDCFRSSASAPRLHLEASVALTMFLARNANGAPFNAPSIKR